MAVPQARLLASDLRSQANQREVRLTAAERAELARRCSAAEARYRRLKGVVANWREEVGNRYTQVKQGVVGDKRLEEGRREEATNR